MLVFSILCKSVILEAFKNFKLNNKYTIDESNKRDYTLEKQKSLNVVKFSKCPSSPLPFYGTQIINSFLSSMISANHDKGEGFQLIVKSIYPLLFLYFNISFNWTLTRPRIIIIYYRFKVIFMVVRVRVLFILQD